MNEYKCKRCEKIFKDYNGLRIHSGRIHKIESGIFYCEFYLNNIWPTCKCGCGKKVKWNKNKFREYATCQCASKIRLKYNNPFTSQRAKDKSAETRRKQFASGERVMWSKGLSMKDESIQKMARNVSNSINSNPDELKRRSDFMFQQWENGKIKALFGPDSSRWKGGTSEVNNIARASKRLYDEWKYPILVRDGFKCIECGESHRLHIHHDKEKFCEIVEKHMPDIEEITDFELKKSIAEKIIDYHIKNKVSGITLCDKCHEKYHPSMNFN